MLQPRQPEPVNSVVSYHLGPPKTPAYEGFRVVDSRKCPELSDVGWAAGAIARHLRLKRVCREQGFKYSFQAMAYLRSQAEQPEESPEWPVVADRAAWVAYSDMTLTGEGVARVLCLDDSWRAMLGLPRICDFCGAPEDSDHDEAVCQAELMIAPPFEGLDGPLEQWKDGTDA